jgi:hypothetical protein
MKEGYLKGMARDLTKRHKESRGETRRVGGVYYGQVIYGALQIINLAREEHKNRQPLTNDGRLEHKLKQRALVRTSSFADHLVGINRPE